MLTGWEGLGITSYLLIIFYSNWNRTKGRFLTILRNRLGDIFLIVRFIFLLLKNFYSFSLLIFIVSRITKRAQFPFRRWLPAAMAAPTPVSALVHSRTLVTAGIFLAYRFNVYLNSLITKNLLLGFFIYTIVLGSISAFVEKDIKQLVAFSTLSQLGIIFITFYSSYNGLFFFHILIHAFFKSVIFIKVGMIIISLRRSQNLSESSYKTFTKCSLSIFLLSLINIIRGLFLSGFFRKELSLRLMDFKSILLLIFLYIFVGLTFLYSFRLLLHITQFFSCLSFINFTNIDIINRISLITLLFRGQLYYKNIIFFIKFNFYLKFMVIISSLFLIFKVPISFIFLKLKKINFFIRKLFFMVYLDKDSINLNFYNFNLLLLNIRFWKNLVLVILIIVLV